MLITENYLSTDVENGEGFPPSQRTIRRSPLPPPQDATHSFRWKSNNANNDERRYFLKTDEKTFRPIHSRKSRQSKAMDAMTTQFFSWAFRSPFLVLIVVAQISCFIWTCIFALFHVWNVMYQPNCVNPPFEPHLEPFSDLFRDCWQLSWTTFATVGYGVVAPSTVGSLFYTNNKTPLQSVRSFRTDEYCFAQSFLCSIEAFVGILFVGFWTAVLFSKVAKVNHKARVSFSSQLVVYRQQQNKRIPFPVLEFRILNEQHSETKGGMINASINVVASLRKEQLKNRERQKSMRQSFTSLLHSMKKSLTSSPPLQIQRSLTEEIEPDMNHVSLAPTQRMDLRRTLSSPTLVRNIFNMFQDSSNMSASKSSFEDLSHNSHKNAVAFVFTPLTVEPKNFPLFQQVWTIRHVLDEKSPLLKSDARSKMKDPVFLSNLDELKKHIHFEKILVSLSGTSQLNASSVYSNKIYDFEDLHVGHEFENMLIKKDETTYVEETKLSKTQKQPHGKSHTE